MRDVSVSTAFSMLQIDEKYQSAKSKEHQAISSRMKPASTPVSCHGPSLNSGLRKPRIDSTESALILFQAPGDRPVAPKTPSHIPVPRKSEAVSATPATPSKTPRSYPQNPPFLSKDSNITSFVGWDMDGRVGNMEAMYEKLKDGIERNGLNEVIEQYKARSRFNPNGAKSLC